MGDITFALRGGEAWRSPWADYRRLRDESPVHFVPAVGENTDFHVLSRFADVFRAVRDTETFSSAQGLTPNADAMTMFDAGQEPIVMMDPPDHTAMRRLVGKQMTPRRVSQIEGAVGAFVDTCLDRVADAGGSAGDLVGGRFALANFFCRRLSFASSSSMSFIEASSLRRSTAGSFFRRSATIDSRSAGSRSRK